MSVSRFVAAVTPPDRLAPMVRIDSIGSITAGTTVFINPTVAVGYQLES